MTVKNIDAIWDYESGTNLSEAQAAYRNRVWLMNRDPITENSLQVAIIPAASTGGKFVPLCDKMIASPRAIRVLQVQEDVGTQKRLVSVYSLKISGDTPATLKIGVTAKPDMQFDTRADYWEAAQSINTRPCRPGEYIKAMVSGPVLVQTWQTATTVGDAVEHTRIDVPGIGLLAQASSTPGGCRPLVQTDDIVEQGASLLLCESHVRVSEGRWTKSQQRDRTTRQLHTLDVPVVIKAPPDICAYHNCEQRAIIEMAMELGMIASSANQFVEDIMPPKLFGVMPAALVQPDYTAWWAPGRDPAIADYKAINFSGMPHRLVPLSDMKSLQSLAKDSRGAPVLALDCAGAKTSDTYGHVLWAYPRLLASDEPTQEQQQFGDVMLTWRRHARTITHELTDVFS